MGGPNGGVAQASRAERRVLEGMLDATAAIIYALEETERESDSLREALGRIRHSNALYTRLLFPRDTQRDLRPNLPERW